MCARAVCVVCKALSREGVLGLRLRGGEGGVGGEGVSRELGTWLECVGGEVGEEKSRGGGAVDLNRSCSEPVRDTVAAGSSAAANLRRKGAVRRGAGGGERVGMRRSWV